MTRLTARSRWRSACSAGAWHRDLPETPRVCGRPRRFGSASNGRDRPVPLEDYVLGTALSEVVAGRRGAGDGDAHFRRAGDPGAHLRRLPSRAASPRRLRSLRHDALPALRTRPRSRRRGFATAARDGRRAHARAWCCVFSGPSGRGALSRRLRRPHGRRRPSSGAARGSLPRRHAGRRASLTHRTWQFDGWSAIVSRPR